MIQGIWGVIISIGIVQAGTTLITKVDSSGNQYTLYGNVHESIDFANGYILVVNRGFESTDVLNVHISADQGSTWINYENVYNGSIGEAIYKACYPTIYGGMEGPYIFFPYADTTFAGMAGIKGVGWGDSILWGGPKIIPSKAPPFIAVGKQVGNGNVVVISVPYSEDGKGPWDINYTILSDDLKEVIDSGRALDTTITGWLEGWDYYRKRICISLWLGKYLHGYVTSKNYGRTWGYIRHRVIPDSSPFGNDSILIPQRQAQIGLRDDGIPLYVGAIVPADSSIKGMGTNFWYYSGEIYTSSLDPIPRRIRVSKSLYHRALFPSIATGGGKIVVAWLEYTDSIIDKDSDNNKTDIFYAVSEDGGYTWSEPENLTNTPDIIECWPRLAKRIDTLNQKAYLMFATSWPNENLDIERLTITKGFKFEQPIYINVAVIDLGPPSKIETPPPSLRVPILYPIRPNPFKTAISVKWLAGEGSISLEVYDVQGRLVRTLTRIQSPESKAYTSVWDGRDDEGRLLPSGIYFIELKTANYSKTQKVILFR